MTRVRYDKVGNFLVSKPMVAGRNLITVTLYPETKQFVVTNEETQDVNFTSEPHSSIPILKMAAKIHLKTLGVVFEDEVRNFEPT